LATKQERICFEGHKGPVHAVAFAPNIHHIVSGGADKTIRLWDLNAGKPVEIFEGHTGDVTAVACSADGRHMISGSTDKTARIWQMPK